MITVLWCMSAAACLTLGAMHFLIWLKSRTTIAHLVFAVACLGVAGIGAGELLSMLESDPSKYASILRWTHLPRLIVIVAIAAFVWLYFGVGRLWLGLTAVGVRCLAVLLNFTIPVNLQFREITTLKQVSIMGQHVSVVAEAVNNPWGWLAELSAFLLLVFVIDASVSAWRKGGPDRRRKALTVGGSIALFLLLAATHTYLIHTQVIQSPSLISVAFLFTILAMGWQLSDDVIRAVRLGNELHARERQWTLAAAGAKLTNWSWDIPEDNVWITAEGRKMYGFGPDEPLTKDSFLNIIHPDDIGQVQRALEHFLKDGGNFDSDYRIVRPDGTIRWITARGTVETDTGKTPLRMVGVSFDNTERWQAEERSRLIVESSPYAMLMVNASGSIVLANRQAEITFGYVRDELVGKPIEVLIPARLRAGHEVLRKGNSANQMNRALGTGRELIGLRKDGTEAPVEIGLNQIRISEQVFFLATVVDITERKRAESVALEQRNELAHLSRVASLGQLSGSLAHELNQPLGAILSNAQAALRMLVTDSPNVGELREILSDIVSEDRRAGEVIIRLRALLKRGEVQLLPLELNRIIDEVLQLLHSDMVGRGITIRTAAAPHLTKVLGDQVQLQQVLLNLIFNASEAMEDLSPEDRLLLISTSSQEGKVRVSLEDRGCGLPNGDTCRIFDPFFTTKSQGLGMGLPICKSIIEAHHGRLWAESNAVRGAIFHMEFDSADA